MTIDDGIIFRKDEQTHKLHPAIDIVNDIFYFGFLLPVETEQGTITKDLCLVTSERDCIRRENLSQRHLTLKVPSVVISARWDTEDMLQFLQSQPSNEDYHDLPFQICRELKKYIEFADEKAAMLVSIWIIGTYLQPIWPAYSYISITGTKRSGKTKLLHFISMLAFNPVFSASTSGAMLYRMIESLRCTFLLDESERLSSAEKHQDLRSILDSGYKNAGIKVIRGSKNSKGQIVPEWFDVYSPKVLVTYKGLIDVTEDRCIPIVMLRAINKTISRPIPKDDAIWQTLRNRLYRFALDKFRDIKRLMNEKFEIPFVGYTDREEEIWKPIFALASYFGLFRQIREYAIERMKEKIQDEMLTKENILLQALAQLVVTNGDREYYVSEIRGAFSEVVGADGSEIPSAQWIGSTLCKQYKLYSNKHKDSSAHGRWKYYLTKELVKELCCKRYGIFTEDEFDQLGAEKKNIEETADETKIDAF